MKEETETTPPRRRFIDLLLGTSLGATLLATCYPLVRFLVPPQVAESAASTVVAGKTGELQPNSGKIFKFGSRAALLVRTPTGEFRCFSATCTHLDCTVQYRQDLQHIWCACHDGHYDLNGRNLSGPPPRPLEEYKANVRGDEIIVSRS